MHDSHSLYPKSTPWELTIPATGKGDPGVEFVLFILAPIDLQSALPRSITDPLADCLFLSRLAVAVSCHAKAFARLPCLFPAKGEGHGRHSGENSGDHWNGRDWRWMGGARAGARTGCRGLRPRP